MQGSIEQLYPRTRLNYEEYAHTIFRAIKAQTVDVDKKAGGNNMVVLLNALLGRALSETDPLEIKGLVALVDEQCNKKIETYNKDIGKTKSKLKGAKLYEDGDGDFSHLDKEEKVDEEEVKQKEEELAAKQLRDEEAQIRLAEKQAAHQQLQKDMKKEERKVTNEFSAQGFKPMAKKDDDFMGGFGGKKKKKK